MQIKLLSWLTLTTVAINVVSGFSTGSVADPNVYQNGYNSLNSGYSGITGVYSPPPMQQTRGGLPTLASYRGYGYPNPRQMFRFLPIPIVKKVTHHHIHHVIAHKGVVKSKYSNAGTTIGTGGYGGSAETTGAANGLDFDNSDKTEDNYMNFHEFKNNNTLRSDFNDNGYKSSFDKRVGSLGLASAASAPVRIHTQPSPMLAHMGASSLVPPPGAKPGGASPIQGYIGDQKANFLPVVIGIIDDGSGVSQGSGGDFYPNSGQYSSRQGLLGPHAAPNRRPYIPSAETIKLFEDLAKMGFK